MGMDYKQGYCTDCGKRVRAERKGTNHVLHLILSIVTLGIWLIIWILSSIKVGGYMCPTCGGSNIKFRLFGIGPLPK